MVTASESSPHLRSFVLHQALSSRRAPTVWAILRKCGARWAMQHAPPLMSDFTLGICTGTFQLRLEVDQLRICSLVSVCQCAPLRLQVVLLTPFAGGSCIATIASSCRSRCLEGCTIVHPDSASDCKWQITRVSSRFVVADLANGCLVNIIQESGDWSECVNLNPLLLRLFANYVKVWYLPILSSTNSHSDHQNLRRVWLQRVSV